MSWTHSVPFQVLRYCTIWSRLTAPEATNPANALFFLLVMVPEFVQASGHSSRQGRMMSAEKSDHERRRTPRRVIYLRNAIKADDNHDPDGFFFLQNNHGDTKVRTWLRSSNFSSAFQSPRTSCFLFFENLRGLCLRLLGPELPPHYELILGWPILRPFALYGLRGP